MMGLTTGSYEAYCFDQAVWIFGSDIVNKLEAVGRKPQKGEAANQAARERLLKKMLGEGDDKQQFADPAAFFS